MSDQNQPQWTARIEDSGIVSVWHGEECIILAMPDDKSERKRIYGEFKKLCKKHNAALAEERETLSRTGQMLIDRDTAIDKLEQQLAAEREKPKTTEYAQGWDDHVLAARAQIEELNEQLAAEREWQQEVLNKLAAQNRTLVDALKESARELRHANSNAGTRAEIAAKIDDALAKVSNSK